MNYCPVYEKIGGHAYQATYPGPIGEVISPQLFGMDKHGDVLSFCSLCNRCSEVCPVKIPLGDMIRKLRRDKMGEGANPPIGTEKLHQSKQEKFIFHSYTNLLVNGTMFNTAIKAGSMLMPVINAVHSKLPVIKNWTKNRTMPQIKGDLHKRVKELEGVSYE